LFASVFTDDLTFRLAAAFAFLCHQLAPFIFSTLRNPLNVAALPAQSLHHLG
jgi:hypothetical protein